MQDSFLSSAMPGGLSSARKGKQDPEES
jgi:hypothetical protein